MTEGNIADLVAYRMSQASETLRDAVNGAYYGMFHALLALLATRQLGTSRHSGAIALFDREFVKTGLFPLELSKSLHLAFDLRQTHDYGELAELHRPTVVAIVHDARTFVAAVASYLKREGLIA